MSTTTVAAPAPHERPSVDELMPNPYSLSGVENAMTTVRMLDRFRTPLRESFGYQAVDHALSVADERVGQAIERAGAAARPLDPTDTNDVNVGTEHLENYIRRGAAAAAAPDAPYSSTDQAILDRALPLYRQSLEAESARARGDTGRHRAHGIRKVGGVLRAAALPAAEPKHRREIGRHRPHGVVGRKAVSTVVTSTPAAFPVQRHA